MTKKIVVICILCFMLCMFIEPGLASLQNNFIGINQETRGPVKITENLRKEEIPLNKVSDKKNLTESQKKLSTALLLQTPALNSTSPRIKNASQSSLTIKNIPVVQATSGLQSASSKLPSGKLVYVYVNVKPGYSTHIVDSLVADVTDRDEDNHLAVGWVDIQNLLVIAGLEGVRNIREVIPPVVNMGSVTTLGDAIHKTANVRSTYGYTGAGMKIGIISDGVDNIADSKASGDLPANVTVLNNTIGGDEGTAMLEIVHDMVPDAKLYFHDHGSNTIAFNSAIDELQANGCTIICDDISWTGEPFFEDGIVATHVSTLVTNPNNPLIYVSSAGNRALQHYQGDFFPMGTTNFTDFSRGADPTYQSLYINLPAQSTVSIVLEWNDQFGNSANDYDLYLSQLPLSSIGDLGYSEIVQNGTGYDPLEYITYTNTGNSTIDAEIDIYKYKGVGKTLELYIYPSDASVYLYNIVPADSIFGHPAVPDVIAVAAVPASSPSTIEPFSSRGPVTISYPSAVSRQKPDISGVDGVAVTGAGGFLNPFYGTSASAPHIAAIAAQIWGAYPTLTPAQVRSALYSYAVDLGSAGKDTTFGYGRADALAMVSIGGNNPTISSISPAAGINMTVVSITDLAGTNFVSGATVHLNQSGTFSPVHKGSIINGTGGALLNGPTKVHVSGNYAYVASYQSNALEIVDISNPAVPIHKGKIMDGDGGALLQGPHGVVVSGNYAYVISAISNALEIVDISNPATPIHKGSITNGAGGAQLYIPNGIAVSGNNAYVVSNSNALEIIDVSNPAAPVHKSSIGISDYPYDVYISGNYAYVANNLGNALEIIDITNPAVPVKKGSISDGTGGALLSTPWAVYVYGNYAYVVGNSNALEIVNISNPAAPVHTGSLINGAGGALLDSPAGVYVFGNQAYVTSQNSNALEIVDVSNPAAPVHRASITNGTGGALLSSPWGIYVSGNYAYIASSYSNALEIVDLGFISATGVNVVNQSKITGSFNLTGIPAGQYNVVVTNPDGQQGMLVKGFMVINSAAVSSGIGVYRPSTHTFYLKNGTALSWTTTAVNWGTSTDLPVTGDWNGDGITDVGVYRPSAHTFYLKNGTALSWTTTAVNWGTSTDLPVTGDWNGDGIAEVGVYRPSAHTFYLKNGTALSWTTTVINWGISTDLPVIGDWNGDGIAEVGVYRPSAYTFYLKNGTALSWTTTAINWGTSTDLPVTGDWNGDGITEVGVYRPSAHMFYLKNGTTTAINWGASTDLPVTGKW